MTKVFVEQLLASPGSAKKLPLVHNDIGTLILVYFGWDEKKTSYRAKQKETVLMLFI